MSVQTVEFPNYPFYSVSSNRFFYTMNANAEPVFP